MSDKQSSRRKFLGSLVAIGAGAAAGGVGTYSYLSDEELGNFQFTSGSIALQVTPGSISYEKDDGDEMMETITIKNVGTLPTKNLLISAILTGDGSSGQLYNAAAITTLRYRGEDILGEINSRVGDPNGNKIFDLADLHHHCTNEDPIDLESLVSSGTGPDGLEAGEAAELELGVTLDYRFITQSCKKEYNDDGEVVRVYDCPYLVAKPKFRAEQRDEDTSSIQTNNGTSGNIGTQNSTGNVSE